MIKLRTTYRKLHLLTPEQLATNMKIEFGGVIEIGYNLYAITGNHEDLELSNFFYDPKVLDSLADKKSWLSHSPNGDYRTLLPLFKQILT